MFSLFGGNKKSSSSKKDKNGAGKDRPSSGVIRQVSSSSSKRPSSSNMIEGLGKARSLQDYQKRMSVKQLESVMMTETYFDVNESSKREQYQQFEVTKVSLPSEGKLKVPIAMGVLDSSNSSRPQIDAMLIDEELLYLDEAEADRVYLALKEKSQRRRKQEARENRLSNQMMIDDSYIDEEHFSSR
jgi:hypothetical protein